MSEIMALCIPTILIPSPHVTDNHQLKNAIDLVNKDAALLVEEKDLDGDTLVRLVDKILYDEKQYNKIKNNLSKISIKDSATKIYEEIKNLVNRS
jgi:UDP-N-acetylglucosamine--N-acetylmuramyl-(pentapeptide) pyrophosphoryl-undecaprenol N-acetylglucosamine transferase